jgi:hypothetical protein
MFTEIIDNTFNTIFLLGRIRCKWISLKYYAFITVKYYSIIRYRANTPALICYKMPSVKIFIGFRTLRLKTVPSSRRNVTSAVRRVDF